MAGAARNELAAQVAASKSAPRGEMLEGVVVAGSWDAAEGVCQVLVGDTVGYEAPFFADGNQPFMPICTLLCPAIGDQYAPVGGERALIWESQGSWVCWLEHGPDDTSQVPSGERWIQHRSATAASDQQPTGGGAAPMWDSSLKLTNDGPTTGDNLGGAILGGTGSLTQSQTKSGARSTIDDTAEKIEHVTAGGLTAGSYDQLKQIVHSVVAAQLETIIDGLAQKITHQASPTVRTIIDGAGNEIAHIVPAGSGKIGLGDFFENLPAASGAINNDILTTFGSNINLANLQTLINLAHAMVTAGIPNASALIPLIVASLIQNVSVPDGSPIVRLAS